VQNSKLLKYNQKIKPLRLRKLRLMLNLKHLNGLKNGGSENVLNDQDNYLIGLPKLNIQCTNN
jgi:hypothetical protein